MPNNIAYLPLTSHTHEEIINHYFPGATQFFYDAGYAVRLDKEFYRGYDSTPEEPTSFSGACINVYPLGEVDEDDFNVFLSVTGEYSWHNFILSEDSRYMHDCDQAYVELLNSIYSINQLHRALT